jgi:hypothetical protein
VSSKDLTSQQGALALARKPARSEVATDAILRQKSLLDAINLMFNLSGLEDKEIYTTLEIDPGHFSKIRKGTPGYYFPANKLDEAMALCESDIPLVWLAYARGKGVHMLETEAERRLRIAAEANEQLQKENALLRNLLVGKAA